MTTTTDADRISAIASAMFGSPSARDVAQVQADTEHALRMGTLR